MKYLAIFTIIAVLCSNTPAISQTVTPLGHIYTHGFAIDDKPGVDDMMAYRDFVRDRFPITFAGYNGQFQIWYNHAGLEYWADTLADYVTQIQAARNYIAIGYSAGGLITRLALERQGVMPTPNPATQRVVGYVSINTPNAGTAFGGYWGRKIFERQLAFHIGNMSLEYWWGMLTWLNLQTFLQTLLSQTRYVLDLAFWTTKPIGDLKRNSDVIDKVQSLAQRAREESMDRGRVHIWSRWNAWNLPCFISENPEARREWWISHITRVQNRINDNERDYRNHRRHMRWYTFWRWAAASYHRARISILLVARGAYYGVERDFNVFGGIDNTESDGFISRASQTASTGSKRWEVSLQNANGEEAHGRAGRRTPHSEEALRDALNLLGVTD